ncbi:hypothetical protein RHGRI_033654 [Rhododendron griersonianum]|uniref:Uncharacterized protein n=1 Tax=Rhododendron griersonianum TaxID=479676 RepID=A0AAV6HXN7_9ERIC|nr:hypothetical protein RHGRI_033654 [Rhododendron griersonianum]
MAMLIYDEPGPCLTRPPRIRDAFQAWGGTAMSLLLQGGLVPPCDGSRIRIVSDFSNSNMPLCDIRLFQPIEIYVDDEAKLTLHGLVQHYVKLSELEKDRKLNDLLDALDFNKVLIFVKSVNRAVQLNNLLVECKFPSMCVHSAMSQEERHVFCQTGSH